MADVVGTDESEWGKLMAELTRRGGLILFLPRPEIIFSIDLFFRYILRTMSRKTRASNARALKNLLIWWGSAATRLEGFPLLQQNLDFYCWKQVILWYKLSVSRGL
jgi:hypothetical protein